MDSVHGMCYTQHGVEIRPVLTLCSDPSDQIVYLSYTFQLNLLWESPCLNCAMLPAS